MQVLIALAYRNPVLTDKLKQPKIRCCNQLKIQCHILSSNLLQQPIFSFSVDLYKMQQLFKRSWRRRWNGHISDALC